MRLAHTCTDLHRHLVTLFCLIQATRISWPSIIWIIFLLHRDYMQRVLFVAELEALHMSSSLSAFQNCNKEGLVRSLWRNHAQEPRVNQGGKQAKIPFGQFFFVFVFFSGSFMILNWYRVSDKQ